VPESILLDGCVRKCLNSVRIHRHSRGFSRDNKVSPRLCRGTHRGLTDTAVGVIFLLMPDHVLMCLSIPPQYAVSQVVGYIKGKSAIQIARKFTGRLRNFTGCSPCIRGATPTSLQPRCPLRTTPANGLTACRMRLHTPCRDLRPLRQLRPNARSHAYRGLRAFASLSMARSEGSSGG